MGRITGVRKQLFADLTELMPEKDWSFVTRQIGMFSFTGLSKEQVENMTNKWHIYMTFDGRISLSACPPLRRGTWPRPWSTASKTRDEDKIQDAFGGGRRAPRQANPAGPPLFRPPFFPHPPPAASPKQFNQWNYS